MSWVTIAVFAILILFGVSGWRKGIIRTAVSLAAMVVTFIDRKSIYSLCVGDTIIV